MTMPQHDPNLLAYLQAWRQYLEQVASAAVAPGFAFPVMPQLPSPAMPLVPPPIPPMPPGFGTPMPPAFGPPPIQPTVAPADHTQQLLTALQAWRQFLEQALRTPAAGGAAPAPVDDSSRREKDRVPPLIDNGGRTSETTTGADAGETAPWVAPGYETPAPRVGSAYAPEGGAGTYGGTTDPAPRSLYSSAAEPYSVSGTEWWSRETPVAGAPTRAGRPDSDQSKSAPDADQTQSDTNNGLGDASNGSKLDPPKWKELLGPRDPGGSLHPLSPLSHHAADLLSVRPVNDLQSPSFPRLSR